MQNKARTVKHRLILLATCGMSASALGLNMNVIGVFYQPVAQDLDILVGTFSFHSTLSALAFSFIALFIPRFLDYIEPKKLVLLGIVIASLSTVGMAFTSQVWVFYLLGILRGLGAGLLGPITITTLINNWFDERNSLALTFALSFAGIIGVIMSPVLTWTIYQFGWRISFIIMGVLLALFNLPAVLIKFELRPEKEGLVPYGAETIKEDVLSANNKKKTQSLKQVSYISFTFITLFLIGLLHTYSGGLVQNLPGFAVSIDFSSALGATMLSAAMFGNITFKLFLGILGEKVGIIMNVLISLSLTLISLLLIITVRNPYLLIVISFVFGASFYIPGIGLPLLTNYFYGKQTSNRIYPILAFVAGVGVAVSLSLVSFVYDFTGSFLPAFWLSITFTIICIIMLVNASRKYKEAKSN